jgi:hypothetical protein
MKTGCLFFRVAALLIPAALLCAGKALGAAEPAAGSPAGSAGVTNAEPAIPLSVFVVPATREEGKDPFFPRSLRPYGSAPVRPNTNAPVQLVIDLKLNGISGTAEHRLAIINGRTFDQGEDAEVRSGATRVRVRVVEIKPDYVIVEAAGQRQILRLRTGL